MDSIKKAVHYTELYLMDPQHPVTINVIGCGGTGSQVLNSLARMNSALKALGHPGLFVKAIDPDRVSEANMGRQLFSPADVDNYKASVLIGRINRFFGYDWEATPMLYNIASGLTTANITISCVDSGAARTGIKDVLKLAAAQINQREAKYKMGRGGVLPIGRRFDLYEYPYYWMDFGNMMDRGQVVLGTVLTIKQPTKSEYMCRASLPTIEKLHPDIFKDKKGDDQGPSCSLAESLGKQDLFINSNLANMGLAILWKMFREMHIKYHGLYLNLETMSVNPIKVK